MSFSTFASGNDWAVVSGSTFGGMAIKEDGSLWTWGTHYPGAGRTPVTTPPVQVGADRDWSEVETSGLVYYAIKQDGSLWYWGKLVYHGPYEPVPQPLSGDAWSKITSNAFCIAALERDGSLWVQGPNARLLARNLTWPSGSELARVGNESDWVNILPGHHSIEHGPRQHVRFQLASGPWDFDGWV